MSRVLVTAGAHGIGRAVAETFLSEGAAVHVGDIDAEALSELARSGANITSTRADVADADDVDRLFDDARCHLGGLDVLINNAGIAGPTAALQDIEPPAWARTIEVNLNGAYLCTRRAIPMLKEAGGGAIVNVSSTAGLLGYPLRAPYAASKWALIGLTKTLAMELGPFGIRVNAVCPGGVSGERMDRVVSSAARSRGVTEDQARQGFLRQVSMRTFVDVSDVASTISFLCSEKSTNISGQAIAVDGHTEGLSLS